MSDDDPRVDTGIRLPITAELLGDGFITMGGEREDEDDDDEAAS